MQGRIWNPELNMLFSMYSRLHCHFCIMRLSAADAAMALSALLPLGLATLLALAARLCTCRRRRRGHGMSGLPRPLGYFGRNAPRCHPQKLPPSRGGGR